MTNTKAFLIVTAAMLGSGATCLARAEEIPTLRQLDEGQAHELVSPFGALGSGQADRMRESMSQARAREQLETERLARQNQQIDRKLSDEICDGC